MSTESVPPKFTAPAARIWNAISPGDQQTLVSAAWCSNCHQEVTIVDYSGSIKAGHVLLRGTCSSCDAAAYRFVEVNRNPDKSVTVVIGKPRLTSEDAMHVASLAEKKLKSAIRRRRLLQRKELDGSISKAELKEQKQLSSKGMNENLKNMMMAVLQLSDTIDR
jgi:hypothetical protein